MLSTYSQASLLNLPSVAEVKKLVEDSLTHDWILRIEHFGPHAGKAVHEQWMQWGDSLFAVKDASSVIDSIVACRTSHPEHAIRLNAEKVRPRSQLYYWVYTPEQNVKTAPPLIAHDSVNTPARISNWISRLGDSAVAARTRLWRIVTVIGMLFASLLMIEEVMA